MTKKYVKLRTNGGYGESIAPTGSIGEVVEYIDENGYDVKLKTYKDSLYFLEHEVEIVEAPKSTEEGEGEEGEPVEKYQFKVGDRVKVTTPYVVLTRLKGQEGVITTLYDPKEGEQEVEIKFSCGTSQTAFVDTDGVILVTPQEEDEWSDWIEDRDAWFHLQGGDHITEYKGGCYVRHKEKKEPAKKLIEVGGAYRDHQGLSWECIFIEDDIAYMRADKDCPAFRFTIEGENISKGGGSYNIDWTKA
jgi:hypothetical protein